MGLLCGCHGHNLSPMRPEVKIHSDGKNVGHFRRRPAPRPRRDPRPRRARDPPSATRSRPAGCAPASACRPRARSPPTSASRGTRLPRPTASSSPRGGSPRCRARARASPSAPTLPEPTAAGARRHPGRRIRYDLSPGSPDVSAFPRSAWLAATRRALSAASFRALDYGDPRGQPELRAALADYVARARGVRATPDRVVVCSGFTQGFRLLCEALRARGARTLAIERYIQPATAEAARACGLRLAPVDVDDDGAAVERLGSADVALLTPAHQFPIGAPLVARRRAIAVEWAHGIRRADHRGRLRRRVPLRPPPARRRSRRWPRSGSCTPEPRARRSRPVCGSAGSSSPPTSSTTSSPPRRSRTATAARSTSSRWRS